MGMRAEFARSRKNAEEAGKNAKKRNRPPMMPSMKEERPKAHSEWPKKG